MTLRILLLGAAGSLLEAKWETTYKCHFTNTTIAGLETFSLKNDSASNMVSIEWTIADRFEAVLRSTVAKPPSCEAVQYVLNATPPVQPSAPEASKWSRSDALAQLGEEQSAGNGRSCPEFPLILDQSLGKITIDCFFRGIGDSIVSFIGPSDNRCLVSADLDMIDSMCRSFDEYTQSFLAAAAERDNWTDPTNVVKRLANTKVMELRTYFGSNSHRAVAYPARPVQRRANSVQSDSDGDSDDTEDDWM